MKHLKQIGPDIWWAYVTRQTKGGTDFEGDVFQGPNAQQLAEGWYAARSEQPA